MAYHELKAQFDEIEDPIRIYEDYDVMLDNMQKNKYRYYTAGSIKKFLLDNQINDLTSNSIEILEEFNKKIPR